ncbi:MAG: hypothetical protein ACYTEM_02580 [Planctomycetota bacterium]
MKSLYRHKQSGDIFAIESVADIWHLRSEHCPITQFNQNHLFE